MQLTFNDNVDYYYVNTKENIDWVLQQLKNLKDKTIALDTETAAILSIKGSSALDPHTAKIQMLQLHSLEWEAPILIDVTLIGIKETKSVIDYIKDNCLAIAFNAKFDIQQIRSTYNLFLTNVECVQIGLFILASATGFKASKMRGFSFKALCRDLFKVYLNKEEATSNWATKTKTDKQLEYAALDVGAYKNSGHQSYLLEAYHYLKDVLFNVFDMKDIWKLEQQNMVCVSDMEYVGMPINHNVLEALLDQTKEEIDEIKIELAKNLGLEVRQKLVKYKGEFKKKEFLSIAVNKIFNSPVQFPKLISEYLNKEVNDLQGTTLISLLSEIDEDKKDFLNKIILYKQLIKVVDKEWDELINPITKAVHPSYNVIGCSTGRMSSSGSSSKKFNAQALAKREVEIEIDESDYQYSQSLIRG